jgi:hypothetical protein
MLSRCGYDMQGRVIGNWAAFTSVEMDLRRRERRAQLLQGVPNCASPSLPVDGQPASTL